MDKSKLKTKIDTEYCLKLLRWILEDTGITFKRVSLYLGKSTNYVSHVLSGATTLNMQTFLRILKLYNLKPSSFFNEQFYNSFLKTGNPEHIEDIKELKARAEKKLEKLGI